MDVSPVRTSKSGSSDFSIERILSEESRSDRVAPEDVPNWLCCTRYRPPRLPRAVSSNACRSRRSGRHARVPFTATQAAALEAAYSRAPYLAPPALRALAAALQLRDDRIKIWFQNRRARERREKCSSITPPRPVALAPTPRPVSSPWRAHAPDLASFPNQDIFITNLQGIHTFEEPSENSLNSSNEETADEVLDVVTVDEENM